MLRLLVVTSASAVALSHEQLVLAPHSRFLPSQQLALFLPLLGLPQLGRQECRWHQQLQATLLCGWETLVAVTCGEGLELRDPLLSHGGSGRHQATEQQPLPPQPLLPLQSRGGPHNPEDWYLAW